MRSLVRVAAVAVFIVGAAATVGAEEKIVEAPIKKVTVYPDRAQVIRIADLDLAAGEHTLVIDGLPGDVVDASLRAAVGGTEGIVLQRLSHSRQEHLKAQPKQVAELEAELKDLVRNRRQVVLDRLETLNQLKKFVTSLGESVTRPPEKDQESSVIDVVNWSTAYDFMGQRGFNLGDSIRQARQDLEDIDAQARLLAVKLSDLTSGNERVTKAVKVDVKLERTAKIEVTLEYLIPGASWTPMYDARIYDDPDSVEFTCHAEVSQKTGEDWKEVELTLSTAQPSLGAGPGELMPWLLMELPRKYAQAPEEETDNVISVVGTQDIMRKFLIPPQSEISQESVKSRPFQTVDNLLEQVAAVRTTAQGEVFVRGGRVNDAVCLVDGVPIGDPLGGPNGGISATVDSTRMFPTVFRIKRAESIPSGGEAVRVTVASWTLPGTTRLISRPHKSPGAYRLVRVINQNDAPFLPGELSVFAGPNFLGRTAFEQAISPGEEFEIPFGLDDRVTVERKVLSFKKSRRGDRVKLEQTVRITLQNHGQAARTIELEELLPVTLNDRIGVKIGKISPAPWSRDFDGITKWKIPLEPGGEELVDISYEISYPKGLQVSGF